MEIMESIRAAIKELILPDLDRLREESREIRAILTLTNKRLDDVNLHLADQSRRIDETNKRIDETNKRIDTLRVELTERIEAVRMGVTERIEAVRADLTGRVDETNRRIDETNNRIIETNLGLGRLYEVIVRREEHVFLTERVVHLERDVAEIKERLVA